MLPMLFFGTGALLVQLRKHALHANECYDFEQQELEEAKTASLKTCCGCNEDGEDVATTADEENKELTCKYCDEDASCRFCFAGPEKGELIAPCLCVGSQVRHRPIPHFVQPSSRDTLSPSPTCFFSSSFPTIFLFSY